MELTFPGFLSALDVAAMLTGLRSRGYGIADPDSWMQNAQGDWVVSVWGGPTDPNVVV